MRIVKSFDLRDIVSETQALVSRRWLIHRSTNLGLQRTSTAVARDVLASVRCPLPISGRQLGKTQLRNTDLLTTVAGPSGAARTFPYLSLKTKHMAIKAASMHHQTFERVLICICRFRLMQVAAKYATSACAATECLGWCTSTVVHFNKSAKMHNIQHANIQHASV